MEYLKCSVVKCLRIQWLKLASRWVILVKVSKRHKGFPPFLITLINIFILFNFVLIWFCGMICFNLGVLILFVNYTLNVYLILDIGFEKSEHFLI